MEIESPLGYTKGATPELGAGQRFQKLSPVLLFLRLGAKLGHDDSAGVEGHVGGLPGDTVGLQHLHVRGGHGPDETVRVLVREDVRSVLRGVNPHREYVDAVRIVGVYFLKLPQRGTTYRSPGCEEVDHHGATLKAGQRDALTFKVGQRKVRGTLADVEANFHGRWDGHQGGRSGRRGALS